MRKLYRLLAPTFIMLILVLITLATPPNIQAAVTQTPSPSPTPKVTPTTGATTIGTLALVVRGATPTEKFHLVLVETDGSNFKSVGDFTRMSNAVWSPDGMHIAFNGETTQIDVIDPDGSNLKVIQDTAISGGFTWAPDSQHITVSQTGRVVTNIDVATQSTQTRFTVTGQALAIDQLLWSPDGQQLAYMITSKPAEAEIHVIDATGSNDQILVPSTPDVTLARLMWSPDSKKVAYCGRSKNTPGIYIIDLASKKTQAVNVSCDNTAAAWSPDGTQFAYVDSHGKVPGLTIITVTGAKPHHITIPVGGTNPIIDSISWQPPVTSSGASATAAATTAATMVATSASAGSARVSKLTVIGAAPKLKNGVKSGNVSQVLLMDPDGSNPVPLTNDDRQYGFPTWSPDGTMLALNRFGITAFDAKTKPDVFTFVVFALGSPDKPIYTYQPEKGATVDYLIYHMAWSSDSKRLLFFTNGAVHWVSLDGTQNGTVPLKDLKITVSNLTGLGWLPDGKQIAVQYAGTDNKVVNDTVNLDGTNLQSVDYNVIKNFLANPAISPDGNQYFSGYENPYVIYDLTTNAKHPIQDVQAYQYGVRSAAWSPDSTQVAFINNVLKPPSVDLYIINADGTNLHKIPVPGLDLLSGAVAWVSVPVALVPTK